MKILKIEMVHDVVCSWCPIGYANLQQALHDLDVDAYFKRGLDISNPQVLAN